MRIEPTTLLVIVGMGAVTYATRASGLWLMSRVSISPRLEAGLQAIPGAVLMTIIAPVVFTTGPAETLASALTVLVAFRTHSLLPSMLAGILSVVILRTMMP